MPPVATPMKVPTRIGSWIGSASSVNRPNREADNERFYLDEATEREVTTRRRKTMSIILFVILLTLAVVFGVLR